MRRLSARGVPILPLDLTDAEAIGGIAEAAAPDLWIQHAGYTKAYASPDFDLAVAQALNVLPSRRSSRRWRSAAAA